MSDRKMELKSIICCSIVLAALCLATSFMVDRRLDREFEKTRTIWHQIWVGQAEQEVRRICLPLGEPVELNITLELAKPFDHTLVYRCFLGVSLPPPHYLLVGFLGGRVEGKFGVDMSSTFGEETFAHERRGMLAMDLLFLNSVAHFLFLSALFASIRRDLSSFWRSRYIAALIILAVVALSTFNFAPTCHLVDYLRAK
jgi:hypothetical protein